MNRTDSTAEIGMHVFERAGLGKAPFRYCGMTESKYQACHGAPVQPGSSCDYCGQGIMYVCEISSADGRRFKVGCDCVARTGDAGLIAAHKHSPEVRKINREKAAARDARNREAWAAIMADQDSIEILAACNVPGYYGQESWYSRANRVWPMCGAAGRARYLAEARRILAAHSPRARQAGKER